MYKNDPKNVHTYTHPFRGVYGCIWICIFSCMNNKFTFFYVLEYNLFNQPTQKSLYGDLSITGLVGFLIITTQPLTCPRARKKDPSSFHRFISDNFERRCNGCVFMGNLQRE